MKKLIFLAVIIVLGIWLFRKDGLDIFRPLSSTPSPSTSSLTSSTPSLPSFSTSSVGILWDKIESKVKDWTKDINFLDGFEKATTSPMNENFSTHVASFSFPGNYKALAIAEAIIDAGIGESFCSTTLKTGQPLELQGQKNIAGFDANKYTWGEAGAGHQYQGTVYSYKKDDKCYAISLFLYTTTPENFSNNETEAKQFRVEHDAAVKRILEKFESIVSSLQINL